MGIIAQSSPRTIESTETESSRICLGSSIQEVGEGVRMGCKMRKENRYQWEPA
jgi:hypothetical protein